MNPISRIDGMIRASRDKVPAKKQGSSLQQVIEGKPAAGYDEKRGKGFLKPNVFLKLIYQGVQRQAT